MSYKLMIIDDDSEVCEVIKHFFVKRKYGVIIANSGEEALSKLTKEKPELILLDIFMPKMDGIECLKRIRKIDKNLKVIIVTCANDVNIAKTAMELGALDYITKPIGFDALEMAVSAHLFMRPE